MIQVIFFALLIVTFLGGFFAYYTPSKKDPVELMMDSTGYTSTETANTKKTEQIHMVTNKGLMEIRRQMDILALEQNKFLDTIQDQQQILKNTSKDASDVLLQAQQKGAAGKDIFQLRSLAAELQDQQLLLINRGQSLISLNNQLTKNRQLMAEQIDLANINTEGSLHALQQRYISLNNQASGFFDKVNQHNQEVHDQIDKMQSKLSDMVNSLAYNSSVQQQMVKERVQRMMDRQHEEMIRLAANEERCRDLTENVRQNLAGSKERADDLQQKTKDLIEQERQKEEDQKLMIQQRMADQQERMQDQQNR